MIIGIIGGSGLDNPDLLEDYNEFTLETPYGLPSSSIITGRIADVEVAIISRHGKKHTITPTNVNNRANIYALGKLGCKKIISTSAVGSLKEGIKPGDFVIPDQLIDFTKFRKSSFHDNFEQGIVHASLADPFSEDLRKRIIEEANNLGYSIHPIGTTITIEGPRFSTRAESNLFRQWADVIGMTTAPEASLCREAGIEYAVIAMATDYDCWKEGEQDVSMEMVFARMKDNAERVKKLVVKVIDKFSQEAIVLFYKKEIKEAIRTVPNFPKPGIMFRDITTLMGNPEAMSKVMEIFYNRYKDKQIDVVAGIESRGFIFGAILAEKLKAKFVPVRKPGKLPFETVREEYSLEYGKDAIEIHKDAIKYKDNVLIIDDLIATGGTCSAAARLIEKLGGKVVECGFVIELPALKGREKLNYPAFSIVDFEGE